MNAERLHLLSQLYVQIHSDLAHQSVSTVYYPASQLEMEWQGRANLSFQHDIQTWWSLFNDLIRQGEEIGRYLHEAASRIENGEPG
jgi:uncharacterized protein YukE